MKLPRLILFITIFLNVLVGCASNGQPGIGDGEVSDTERVAIRAAIRITTASVIDRYTGITPSAIVDMVGQVRERVNIDGELTLDEIRAVLETARSEYGLSAAEMVALDEIVTVARDNLRNREIGSRASEATASVGQVLEWIESAARFSD